MGQRVLFVFDVEGVGQFVVGHAGLSEGFPQFGRPLLGRAGVLILGVGLGAQVQVGRAGGYFLRFGEGRGAVVVALCDR